MTNTTAAKEYRYITKKRRVTEAVSYTHLTLPTSDLV